MDRVVRSNHSSGARHVVEPAGTVPASRLHAGSSKRTAAASVPPTGRRAACSGNSRASLTSSTTATLHRFTRIYCRLTPLNALSGNTSFRRTAYRGDPPRERLEALRKETRLNRRVIVFRRILLTVSVALLVPLSGEAQSIPDDPAGPYWSQLLAWHCEFGCAVPLNGSVEVRWLDPGFAHPEDACTAPRRRRARDLCAADGGATTTVTGHSAPFPP